MENRDPWVCRILLLLLIEIATNGCIVTVGYNKYVWYMVSTASLKCHVSLISFWLEMLLNKEICSICTFFPLRDCTFAFIVSQNTWWCRQLYYNGGPLLATFFLLIILGLSKLIFLFCFCACSGKFVWKLIWKTVKQYSTFYLRRNIVPCDQLKHSKQLEWFLLTHKCCFAILLK